MQIHPKGSRVVLSDWREIINRAFHFIIVSWQQFQKPLELSLTGRFLDGICLSSIRNKMHYLFYCYSNNGLDNMQITQFADLKKQSRYSDICPFSVSLLLILCRHIVNDLVLPILSYKAPSLLGDVLHHYYSLLWRSTNKTDIWFITEMLKWYLMY